MVGYIEIIPNSPNFRLCNECKVASIHFRTKAQQKHPKTLNPKPQTLNSFGEAASQV